jgi:hypothetical protein
MSRYYFGVVILAALLFSVAGCGGGSTKKGKSLTQQYQEALKIADAGMRAKALAALAEKQQKAGDLLAVGTSLSTAREAASTIRDPVSRANTLNQVAATYARLDQPTDDVKSLLRESAKAIGEIPDADAKIPALSDLAAYTGQYLKNPDAAAAHLKSAEEAAGQIMLAKSKVQNLAKIAGAYHRLEQPAEADRVIAEAAEFSRSQAEPRDQADCLAEIAAAQFLIGKAAEGQAALADAQKAAAAIAANDSHAYALLGIAQKANAAKQKTEARKLLDEAKDLAQKVEDGSIRNPLIEDIDSALKSL